jgi:hypothetical protein
VETLGIDAREVEAMNGKRAFALLATGTLAVGVAMSETDAGRRTSKKVARALTRWARFQSGRLEGFRYRLAGRHPDLAVDGTVLADRVRSTLGPVEHRLDIPRVHVMADGHDVILHGDVGSEEQLRVVLDATGAIPGVEHVRSHLRVGFVPGDTRPSAGAGRRVAAG